MTPLDRVVDPRPFDVIREYSVGVPRGLGGAAIEALRMRYAGLSVGEAAEELWDFSVLAVADRLGPAIPYPSGCWFDSGVAALKTITAGWEEVDEPTSRLLRSIDWYLAASGPLDHDGSPFAVSLAVVEQALSPESGCSDSILLPVRLTHREGDHIIGLHMCSVGFEVHVILLDSAPRQGDPLGLEQPCAMHLRVERDNVLEWLRSPIGEQILAFQGLRAPTVEELAEEIAPWLGLLDWSPAAWAFHPSQVQNSCVPMMTQLAWNLEYAHPRMDLATRTQGHVKAGLTICRWQKELCEMALDLAEALPRPASELASMVGQLSAIMHQRGQELSHMREAVIELPDQLRSEVFEALSSVSLVTSEQLENPCTIEARARRQAQRCLKHLAMHLSRVQCDREMAFRQALWLVKRWTRSVITDPRGRLASLADLTAGDRRLVNLIRTMQRLLPDTLKGYRPAVRRWARRLLGIAAQAPALYPDLEKIGGSGSEQV